MTEVSVGRHNGRGALPGQTAPAGDAVVRAARKRENVIVEEEIVRHKLSSRVIHWSVAFFFFVALLTGLPIWTPVLGWMAGFFGGLNVCRWLHPWSGLLFVVASLVMFIHWFGEMRLEKGEREWLGPKMIQYLKFQGEDPNVGKYNGGQKLFFWAASLGALGLVLSGIVIWFPLSFAQPLREVSYLLHDVTFILFVIAIVGHIYLGTAAEPGTFAAMVRGTVSRRWAQLHHPRWYREVTGGEQRKP